MLNLQQAIHKYPLHVVVWDNFFPEECLAQLPIICETPILVVKVYVEHKHFHLDLCHDRSCSWLKFLDEDVRHESEMDICFKEVSLIESIHQASSVILSSLKVHIYLRCVCGAFLVDI